MSLPSSLSPTNDSYVVAVRALCEFTAKAGDLDLRFTPSPSAREGMAGHVLVAGRRGPGYLSEVSLQGQYRQLTVRGRADGYDQERQRLEEVKTYRGDLALMPANHRALHWAQVRIYGWLMCEQEELADIELALVYFDIVSQKETVLLEHHQASTLQAFFTDSCELFLAWAQQELAHTGLRNRQLEALGFPHPAFRPGQRPLAEAVFKAVSRNRCLLAQAPTGIGKTVGTLFPMLKAFAPQRLDKLFFLTAKTPGRQLALDGLALIQRSQPELSLRVLELVARDKACEHPELACHGESCPLAKGFYDRLPAARLAAVRQRWLDRAGLRAVALAHGICPYYLGQEISRWADVVVADYNYYFDLSAMLYGLTLTHQWRVGVLVDEAHNLVERGRRMYSAELDQGQLQPLRRQLSPALKHPLDRLNRAWNELNAEQVLDYQASDVLPAAFMQAVQRCVSALGDYFNENPRGADAALQSFYFELLHFVRIGEVFDAQFLYDCTLRVGKGGRAFSRLCLRNVVPAGFLAERFKASRATVLFSATLSPQRYYQDLLGLPADTPWVDVESPFKAEQLQVRLIEHVSTRYPDRKASLAPIAALIAEQFAKRPGNYLAFFSSFEYLQQAYSELAGRFAQVPLWAQERGMDEATRAAFIERFQIGGQGVGFAVLGGAFGEGIDLPGERLIGAFVATLGLPQVNPVNEQIKQRMGVLFGAGYDYTYLYPGLQKVIQAAGRVIRTQQDSGVVMLIDDRFAAEKVRALFPGWWQVD